jgi:hypothetical protein
MVLRLSALRNARALLPRNIIILLLILISLRGWVNPRSNAAGKIRQIEKNAFTSSGLEPATFSLVAITTEIPSAANVYTVIKVEVWINVLYARTTVFCIQESKQFLLDRILTAR